MSKANVPIVDRAGIEDSELLAQLAHSDAVGTPPATKLLAMAHAPELAKGMASYWRLTAESGSVDPSIKELGRLTIAQLLGCPVCSSARSAAASVDEFDVQACAMPDFEHPDPPTRTALHFARTLVLDDGDYAACYSELAEHFSWPEIIELAAFFCLVVGDVRMVKSFGLETLLAG
jgi:alkylhydroperoxidase family enzyme